MAQKKGQRSRKQTTWARREHTTVGQTDTVQQENGWSGGGVRMAKHEQQSQYILITKGRY